MTDAGITPCCVSSARMVGNKNSLPFISGMEHAFAVKLLYKSEIFFANGIWHKNKTLVIDLGADIIAYPIFIIKVEHSRIDRFY